MIVFTLFSCSSTKVTDGLCSEWIYLKYPIVKKGYIGSDSSPQGELCYQRKWMSYVGLSKQCITDLLGEPARIEKNKFIYYFSTNPQSDNDGAIGVLYMYFRNGKMKKIHCSIS